MLHNYQACSMCANNVTFKHRRSPGCFPPINHIIVFNHFKHMMGHNLW